MNLPWALATGVSIAAYAVVDGIGVRASGNWVGFTGAMFAFFLLVPLWYLARRQRAMFAIPMAEAGKGGQRRTDCAGGLWRHYLGDAGQPDGRGIGVA